MLDKNSPKPLYAQLEEVLRAAIYNREWESDNMIPSETELSRTYGVSRMTARSVVTQLVNEGLLHRVQGKGTFVVGQKIPTKSLAYMGVREQLEQLGYATKTELCEFKQIPADTRLANKLGTLEGEPIHFIQRVRSINDEPISLHLSYIPRELAPTLSPENMETEQLCVILQRDFALKSAHVYEELESVLATSKEAKLLKLNKSHPLLMLEDIYKTASGRAFEYTKVLFRGDKIKLHFEFSPGQKD